MRHHGWRLRQVEADLGRRRRHERRRHEDHGHLEDQRGRGDEHRSQGVSDTGLGHVEALERAQKFQVRVKYNNLRSWTSRVRSIRISSLGQDPEHQPGVGHVPKESVQGQVDHEQFLNECGVENGKVSGHQAVHHHQVVVGEQV